VIVSISRKTVFRVLTAAVLLPAVILLIWLPSLRLAFGIVMVAFIFIGVREFHLLARTGGIDSLPWEGTALGAAVAVGILLQGAWAGAAVLAAGVMLICIGQVLGGGVRLTSVAVSAFGAMYIGWLGGHVILLRAVPNMGPGLVTMVVVAVATSDGGAYVIGSRMGKHKLAPRVSPNKTWEGAIGGFLCTVAAMAILWALRRAVDWQAYPPWQIGHYMLTGAVLSVVGQFGDLVESGLKREAGVKDSGVVFPGHGGMLDRCDSFLFATPALYYLVTYFGGATGTVILPN